MNIFNLAIGIFILTAFAVGISINDSELVAVNKAIDNATETIMNISLEDSTSNYKIPNQKGFFLVIENGVKFVGSFFIEVMRAGIMFGHDNPEYFSAEFIIKLLKIIIIAFLVSILIKPVLGILIMIVLFFKWLIEKRRKRKNEL